MDKFSNKVVGVRRRADVEFSDEGTGLVAILRDLYPGDELELKHSIYKLKHGVDFDDIKQARDKATETGTKFTMCDFMEMDIARSQIATITRKIQRWNLTDDGGMDLPITPENVGKLDAPLFTLLEKWAGEVSAPAVKAAEAADEKN